jgi:O-antigen ligase
MMPMADISKQRQYKSALLFFILLFYAVLLCLFYKKYIPLIKPFQALLIPLILIIFIISVMNKNKGFFLFVFIFPLVNILPHFFNISESVPHAPAALIIFLFFLLGWLINTVFIRREKIELRSEMFKPLFLCALLIIISSLITIFRYSNFFPFVSENFYELKTNTIGVTAGGAIMSSIFFSLNYLTGFAFFFIILDTLKNKKEVVKTIRILGVSALISFGIGIYQYIGKLDFGINPRIRGYGYVNATFKDSLSLGVFIAVVFTLFLGTFFYEKKINKTLFVILIVLSASVIMLTGSKSGIICLLISVFLFMVLVFGWRAKVSRLHLLSLRNIIIFLLIGVFIFSAVYFLPRLITEDTYIEKFATSRRLGISEENGFLNYLINSRDHLWKTGMLMISDYPITGVGMGAFIIELANYAQKHDISIKTPESAENYFIQVASELGVIGLVLFIWLFVMIFMQIIRQYSAISDKNRFNFIIIGIGSGIIAYFINIQAHSYIGSYEIKYTFWLLVGLLFCLSKTGSEEREKVDFGKKFKVFGTALIILYAGTHLWNSTHSLSLAARTQEFGMKQEFGFYPWEKNQEGRRFRWIGRSGGLTLEMKKNEIKILILASHPEIKDNPVKVKIFRGKNFFEERILLDELNLTRSVWKTHTYSLPDLKGKEIFLLFQVSRTWNPKKETGVPDPRNLGIAIGEITFREKP